MGSAGGSKQKTTGWNTAGSESESRGWNQAQNSSLNQSASGGTSLGSSASQSMQGVWGAQQPGLTAIYDAAMKLAGGGGQAPALHRTSDAANNAWMSMLTPGGNPYFSQNVQGAIDQATQSFNRSVMPELDARGVAAGQYGSPRDNLARGEAAGLFGQGMGRNVTDLYAQQYGIDQQRQATALGMTGAMQQSQLAPLTAAQGLLGGPTVLGQSSSAGQNMANNWGSSFGTSQGTSQGWNQAISDSWAQGKNSGSGSSANVGIGGK